MKSTVFRFLAVATLLAGGLLCKPAMAASNQFVIVISDGVGPQVIDLGKAYLRKADQDPTETTPFDDLAAKALPSKVDANSLADMKGILETAHASGYKTGLVTTGDLTADAELFYNLSGDVGKALVGDAKYDFIAGGGRAKLPEKASQTIKEAGGSYLPDEDSIQMEISGRVLAPQADEDLDFAIDRDPQTQAGLTELASLAMDNLGADDYPFVLIVHDTLVKKAIDAKDSPALMEQLRELSALATDAVARRSANDNFKAAFFFTGGTASPRFTTTVEDEQQNSLELLSNLFVSFHAAGVKLKGANGDALDSFINPTEGLYRSWKIPDATRDQLLEGTLDPEAALRAFYEPALKLAYDGPVPTGLAYVLGFDEKISLVAALKAAVAEHVTVPAPPPEETETTPIEGAPPTEAPPANQ